MSEQVYQPVQGIHQALADPTVVSNVSKHLRQSAKGPSQALSNAAAVVSDESTQTTQQSVESFPTTLGGAAAAVSNMSREVASSFGPLMAALYNAYSQFNKLDLSLAFKGAMATLGGALANSAFELVGAGLETYGVKQAFNTNSELDKLHTQFYGDYPEENNITSIDKQLEAENTGTFVSNDNRSLKTQEKIVGQDAQAQAVVGNDNSDPEIQVIFEQDAQAPTIDDDNRDLDAQEIADQNPQAPARNSSALENDRDRYKEDYNHQREEINRNYDKKNQQLQKLAQLTGVLGGIGQAMGNGTASMYQANEKVVASIASQLMQVLSSMFSTVSDILRNNPNTAITAFASR